MPLKNLLELGVDIFYTSSPFLWSFFPCLFVGKSHLKTVHHRKNVQQKIFVCKFLKLFPCFFLIFSRICKIGLGALPAVKVFLPFFFTLLKFFFQVFYHILRCLSKRRLVSVSISDNLNVFLNLLVGGFFFLVLFFGH